MTAKITLPSGKVIMYTNVHQVKENVIATVWGTFAKGDDGVWRALSLSTVTAEIISEHEKK